MAIDVLQSPTVVAGLVFIASVLVAAFVRNKQLEAQALKDGFASPARYRALDPLMGLD